MASVWGGLLLPKTKIIASLCSNLMTQKAGNFLGNHCSGLQTLILYLSTCSYYVKAECIFDVNRSDL